MIQSSQLRTRKVSETEADRTDYHDWSILELERAAEESLRAAVLLAAERGEGNSDIDVQRYTTILESIRRLRT